MTRIDKSVRGLSNTVYLNIRDILSTAAKQKLIYLCLVQLLHLHSNKLESKKRNQQQELKQSEILNKMHSFFERLGTISTFTFYDIHLFYGDLGFLTLN